MEPVPKPCEELAQDPRMLNLYRDSTGHEAKSRRFWTALLNLFFLGAYNWTISHEQYCHLQLKDGKQAYDTLLEYFDNKAGTHVPHCLIENKEAAKSVEKAETQARDYAKILLDERKISRIFVVVAIGVSFRVWTLNFGSSVMVPCFGPVETSKTHYLNIGEVAGYRMWSELSSRLTNERTGMQPPVLQSQPSRSSASPSDTSMASHSPGGSDDYFSNLADQDVQWVNIKYVKKGTLVEFVYQGKRLGNKRENWRYVEHLGAMVCYVDKFNLYFGNREKSST